jgi:hypothetical protein
VNQVCQGQSARSSNISFLFSRVKNEDRPQSRPTALRRFAFHNPCPYAVKQQLPRGWRPGWWRRWGLLQTCAASPPSPTIGSSGLPCSPLIGVLSSILLWMSLPRYD